MDVKLQAVTALKGAGPIQPFEVAYWIPEGCGSEPNFDVFAREQEGGLYVVFLVGAYPTQDGVLEAMSLDRITDPDIKAALDKAGAAR